MRQVCRFIDGKFVWSDADPSSPKVRTGIVTDTMDALRHPCNNQMYDSKSAFRRATKAYGCEELGNDNVSNKDRMREEREIRSGVSEALREAVHEWKQKSYR